MQEWQAKRYTITTAMRGGAFVAIHYYISAGQAKVPNTNIGVMTIKENVPWLLKNPKTLQLDTEVYTWLWHDSVSYQGHG